MRDITRQMRLQEWAEQIDDWRRSGLTQRQWAKAHGMSLEGFKYPLDGKGIRLGSTLCISNELISDIGTYSFTSGILMVIRSND